MTRKIVYHYCNHDTFLKIVTNKTIRFSDAKELNDVAEGASGREIIEEKLQLYRTHFPHELPKTTEQRFGEDTINIWWRVQDNRRIFVASFSEDGDSIGQWGRYADNERGFAIGFDLSYLTSDTTSLQRVIYDEQKKSERVDKFLGELFNEYAALPEDAPKDWLYQRCADLFSLSFTFKARTWRIEEEVRLIHPVHFTSKGTYKSYSNFDFSSSEITRNVKIDFFGRNGVTIPYFDLPFDDPDVGWMMRPVISVVRLGPQNTSSEEAIQSLLLTKQLGFIPVEKSTIKSR